VWKPRKPLDQIPTPTGVPICPTRIDAFPPGSVLTAFLFFTPDVLRTIARVQPDCAEEKGYTVCNCVVDDGETEFTPFWVPRNRFALSLEEIGYEPPSSIT